MVCSKRRRVCISFVVSVCVVITVEMILPMFRSSPLQRHQAKENEREFFEDLVRNRTFFTESVANPLIPKLRYTHVNSDVCERKHHLAEQERDVFLLCIVPSAPKEGKLRDAIRRTWGNVTNAHNRRIAIIFLLAKSTDDQLEREIARENERHSDIVKENFIDSYNNLTLKTLMGLRWAQRFCKKAKYILKIDHDHVPNLPNLVMHLEKAPNTTFVEGYLWKKATPNRDKKGQKES